MSDKQPPTCAHGPIYQRALDLAAAGDHAAAVQVLRQRIQALGNTDSDCGDWCITTDLATDALESVHEYMMVRYPRGMGEGE